MALSRNQLASVVVTSGVVLRREVSRCWCEDNAGVGAELDESSEAIEANGGEKALGIVVEKEVVLRMNNRRWRFG